MGIIYRIISPTGKIYIGKTYDFKKRFYDYKCKRYRSKKSIIIDSIKKYGWESHVMDVVEEVDEVLLNEREIFWIKELGTYAYENEKGMNLTRGGDGQRHSWKHDVERVNQAKKRCGENAPNYGRKVSAETKKKIADSVRVFNLKNGKKPPYWAVLMAVENRQKPIVCYDKYGHFVSEFKSIKEASVSLGLDRKSVNDAVNGIQKHSGGYVFKNKTTNYPLFINTNDIKFFFRKRTVLCFVGNHVLEYESCSFAANDLGLYHQTVKDAANRNDKKPLRSGHVFIYKDLYENIMREAV